MSWPSIFQSPPQSADACPIWVRPAKDRAPMSVVYKPIDWVQGIPGHRYRVGEDGSVWSFSKGGWKLLKQYKNKKRVTAFIELRNRRTRKLCSVASLVCTAFHGNRVGNRIPIHHPNDDPSDNRACNLRWGNPGNPATIARKGFQNSNSVLQNHDIPVIRKLSIVKGWDDARIARRYGVARATIRSVVKNKTWSHIPWGELSPVEGDRLSKRRRPPRGSKHHQAKIKESDIPVIVDLVREGNSQRSVAKLVGLNCGTISKIVCGKTWKHVPRDVTSADVSQPERST